MRTVVFAAGLFCLSLVALAQETTSQPANGSPPRIQLSTRVWDFGKMWFAEKCETDIEIKNIGGSNLQFLDVKTSCGCTVARPTQQALRPGESDKIHIVYNTRKGVKNVHQTVTISSNDPSEPNITIEVKGEVRNVFDTEPSERITFGQLTQETKSTQVMTLRNNMDKPITPKLMPFDANQPFEASLEEITPGQEYKLSVTTRPPLNAGLNSTNVVLQTGDDRFPTMTIPVTAYSSERVSVSPPQLVVASNATGPQARVVRLNYLPDTPVKILSATSSTPGILVQTLQTGTTPPMNGMFAFQQLRVTLPAFNDIPENGAEVVIETDATEERFKRFVIPVRRYVPTTTAPVAAVSSQPVSAAAGGVTVDTSIRNAASQPAGKPD